MFHREQTDNEAANVQADARGFFVPKIGKTKTQELKRVGPAQCCGGIVTYRHRVRTPAGPLATTRAVYHTALTNARPE
jgi:hypothetical protein